MKFVKPILTTFATIIIVFVIASLFDIVLAVISLRFYSTAAFITVFGVAGIFAGILGYTYGIQQYEKKNETARWSLVLLLLISGLFFFFFLAKIEGGEYESAFKAYGVSVALTCLFFIKGNVQ